MVVSGDACTLSVVMPVYNEDAVIEAVLAEVRREVLDRVSGSELVIINDCSTDQTAAALERASATDSRIRVLTNNPNAGHGISIRRGFDAARGEWIFQIDSDAQVDLAQFDELWRQRADSDLLIGVRAVRHDPRHRLVLTAITRVIVSALARQWVRDANVPFKLVRRSLLQHLAPFMPSDVFAPSILIALGAARTGARVTELEIHHLPRLHGQSTLRVWRLVRACLRSGWQTLRFSVRRLPRFQPGP